MNKILIVILSILLINCTGEDTGPAVISEFKIKNESLHKVTIEVSLKSLYPDIIVIDSFDEYSITHKSEPGELESFPFTKLTDSIIVSFDNSLSVVHYGIDIKTGNEIIGNGLSYSENRNLLNFNNYTGGKTNTNRYEYIFVITEEDYNFID